MPVSRAVALECVGPGWAELVNAVYDALPEGVTIGQVKEKFGGLRVYVNPSENIDGLNLIEKVIEAAEHRSYELCENCGKPGNMRDHSWLRVLCKECDINYHKQLHPYSLDGTDPCDL